MLVGNYALGVVSCVGGMGWWHALVACVGGMLTVKLGHVLCDLGSFMKTA